MQLKKLGFGFRWPEKEKGRLLAPYPQFFNGNSCLAFPGCPVKLARGKSRWVVRLLASRFLAKLASGRSALSSLPDHTWIPARCRNVSNFVVAVLVFRVLRSSSSRRLPCCPRLSRLELPLTRYVVTLEKKNVNHTEKNI
jgi:hypothetical protein